MMIRVKSCSLPVDVNPKRMLLPFSTFLDVDPLHPLLDPRHDLIRNRTGPLSQLSQGQFRTK